MKNKEFLKLLLIILLIMERQFVTATTKKINGKLYLQPIYNLEGYQKYLLPKLQFKGMQHVYFNPNDINQLYQEQNIDPNNLDCNLKYDPTQEVTQLSSKKSDDTKNKLKPSVKGEKQANEQKKQEIIRNPIQNIDKKRPPLRQKGYTHFIHIPLVDACRQTYQNVIKSVIDQNDHDALVPLQTLHATILVFRLKTIEDLPRWKKILQSIKLKKVRITLRGVGIFPVQMNTNFTRVFFIKVDGLDDLIHDVVQKAITEGLIQENQLSHITFDKKKDMYRAEQHLTILKTKGEDIIDATAYLKSLAKLNIPKVTFSDMRMSMIGTFDGKGYFDEMVFPVDK